MALYFKKYSSSNFSFFYQNFRGPQKAMNHWHSFNIWVFCSSGGEKKTKVHIHERLLMHTLIQWGPESVFSSLCPDRRLSLQSFLLPWKQMKKEPLFPYQCCNLSLWFMFHPISTRTAVLNWCKGREWI